MTPAPDSPEIVGSPDAGHKFLPLQRSTAGQRDSCRSRDVGAAQPRQPLTLAAAELAGKGVEAEAPLDEPFDIGVFTAEPGAAGFTAESVLYLQRRPIHTGKQRVTIVVDKLPAYAGVDPDNKRIDRNATITSGRSSSSSVAE
jgi:hypothetical protein